MESPGAGGMLVFGGYDGSRGLGRALSWRVQEKGRRFRAGFGVAPRGEENDLHLYDPEAGSLKQTAGTADTSEVRSNSWLERFRVSVWEV